MFKKREYKSGSRFALWRWTQVDSEYITRLHIFKTPWFAICLHWINKPDPEPYLHDHPVTFLSIILRGWYREVRHRPHRGYSEHKRRWFNWIRASRLVRHTITDVKPGGALTLCLMGPKTQEWGFYGVRVKNGIEIVDAPGWTYWKDYHHAQRARAAADKAVRS
jgi:hypothetical protein